MKVNNCPGVIWLQRAPGQSLSPEGRLIYQHAIMENLKTRFFHVEGAGEVVALNITPADLVVGSVEVVSAVFQSLGVSVPEPDYYPACLRELLGRKVEKTTWGKAREQALSGPVFIKSHAWKLLAGRVYGPVDASGMMQEISLPEAAPVWISEVVRWRSEHRVYVVHDRIVAACQYGEHPDDEEGLDLGVVRQAVDAMARHQPRKAYAFDWGVLESGQTTLIENNDGWAIGAYPGISHVAYFHMLYERWKEIVRKNPNRPTEI